MRSLRTCIVILLRVQPVHATNESDVAAPELNLTHIQLIGGDKGR